MVIAGGFLIVRAGYSGMFTITGILTFAGALFFLTYFRRPRSMSGEQATAADSP